MSLKWALTFESRHVGGVTVSLPREHLGLAPELPEPPPPLKMGVMIPTQGGRRGDNKRESRCSVRSTRAVRQKASPPPTSLLS